MVYFRSMFKLANVMANIFPALITAFLSLGDNKTQLYTLSYTHPTIMSFVSEFKIPNMNYVKLDLTK